MDEYQLDKELLLSITNILKSLIPLFAAFFASYLTYRFAKKDKIRDHLYTYKVKSYSAIVEGVIEVKRELEKKRNTNFFNQNIQAKRTSNEIWEDFRKLTAEQALFQSKKTSEDLTILNDAIFSVVFYESLNPTLITNEKKQEYEQKLTSAIYECNLFVKKIQKELRIDELNKNKL